LPNVASKKEARHFCKKTPNPTVPLSKVQKVTFRIGWHELPHRKFNSKEENHYKGKITIAATLGQRRNGVSQIYKPAMSRSENGLVVGGCYLKTFSK
jgi:hypothetical protein